MKVAIVYASTTGNTEALANAAKEAAEASGAQVYFSTADAADAGELASADLIALGSLIAAAASQHPAHEHGARQQRHELHCLLGKIHINPSHSLTWFLSLGSGTVTMFHII